LNSSSILCPFCCQYGLKSIQKKPERLIVAESTSQARQPHPINVRVRTINGGCSLNSSSILCPFCCQYGLKSIQKKPERLIVAESTSQARQPHPINVRVRIINGHTRTDGPRSKLCHGSGPGERRHHHCGNPATPGRPVDQGARAADLPPSGIAHRRNDHDGRGSNGLHIGGQKLGHSVRLFLRGLLSHRWERLPGQSSVAWPRLAYRDQYTAGPVTKHSCTGLSPLDAIQMGARDKREKAPPGKDRLESVALFYSCFFLLHYPLLLLLLLYFSPPVFYNSYEWMIYLVAIVMSSCVILFEFVGVT
jgi:hypothetical protein